MTRLVEGNRGGSALIHEGYKYQKKKDEITLSIGDVGGKIVEFL